MRGSLSSNWPRPEVDLITGIPPAVSIEQRQSRGGGKSTVATVTEVYHFLRLLFARLGAQYCPKCQCAVQAQTRDEVGRRLAREMKKRGDLLLLAPVVKNRKGFHTDVAVWAAKHGYGEVRADGKMYSTKELLRLDRFREHDVEIVVGRLDRWASPTAFQRKAAREMIETALQLGHGTLYALGNDRRTTVHSTERSCPSCGDSFGPLDPKMFSYNSAQAGAPSAADSAKCFICRTWSAAPAPKPLKNHGSNGRRASGSFAPCQGARLNPIARAVRFQRARGNNC